MGNQAERRIVVGVEGSGYAREALIWAIEEAHPVSYTHLTQPTKAKE